MKGIVINLEELSDSRELMESKEPPKIRWFIYILALAVIVALIVSWFLEVDEYVRVAGEVRTAEISSDVILTTNCKLSKVLVKEGQSVKKGDVLFTFDVDFAKKQKKLLEKQLFDYEEALAYSEKLKDSIEKNENLFKNSGSESAFYYRFEQYKTSGALAALEIENTEKQESLNQESNAKKLESARVSLAEANDQLAAYNELLTSVKSGNNYGGSDSLAASLYAEYVTSVEKASLSAEQYKNAYDSLAAQYAAQQNQLFVKPSDITNAKSEMERAQSALQEHKTKTLNEIEGFIEGWQEELSAAETESIPENISNGSTDANSGMMDEIKETEFQPDRTAFEEKIQAFTLLKAAVEGNSDFSSECEEAQNYYLEYCEEQEMLKISFQEKSAVYQELQDVYQEDARLAYENAKLEPEALRNTFISQVESKTENLRSEIQSLNSTIANLETAMKNGTDTKQYSSLTEDKNKNDALITVEREIDSIENNLRTVQSQFAEIEETVKSGEVKASCDGEVTLLNEMNSGDFLQAGTKLCSIIPNDETLRTMLYIPESDIAKIDIGMETEYLLSALPYAEYGGIRGTIVSLSKDSLSLEGNSSKYYVAQADLPVYELTNKKGEVRKIQNGMLVEAKIICGSKRTFIWLLEKINLMD